MASAACKASAIISSLYLSETMENLRVPLTEVLGWECRGNFGLFATDFLFLAFNLSDLFFVSPIKAFWGMGVVSWWSLYRRVLKTEDIDNKWIHGGQELNSYLPFLSFPLILCALLICIGLWTFSPWPLLSLDPNQQHPTPGLLQHPSISHLWHSSILHFAAGGILEIIS